MAKLEKLIEAIRERQSELRFDIERHSEQASALAELEQRMGGCVAFDGEDVVVVKAEIEAHKNAVISLENKYAVEEERRKAQEELYKYLHTVISDRQSILDMEDGRTQVLEGHPRLLEFMAKKQLDLQKIIEEKLKDMPSSGVLS